MCHIVIRHGYIVSFISEILLFQATCALTRGQPCASLQVRLCSLPFQHTEDCSINQLGKQFYGRQVYQSCSVTFCVGVRPYIIMRALMCIIKHMSFQENIQSLSSRLVTLSSQVRPLVCSSRYMNCLTNLAHFQYHFIRYFVCPRRNVSCSCTVDYL